jgi:hypothetical protein
MQMGAGFFTRGKNTLSMPMVPATFHLYMGGFGATPICNVLTVFFLFVFQLRCAPFFPCHRFSNVS